MEKSALGPTTVCGQAKDFRLEDRLVLHVEESVIGEGILDPATYPRRFGESCADGYVQSEHLPADKIPEAQARCARRAWRGG
ncbi:MAG: hypothetical protein IH862_10870 [Chloroflexi bacterium]|nr:hypothetical protein [Chloroflexota bacterium]